MKFSTLLLRVNNSKVEIKNWSFRFEDEELQLEFFLRTRETTKI